MTPRSKPLRRSSISGALNHAGGKRGIDIVDERCYLFQMVPRLITEYSLRFRQRSDLWRAARRSGDE